ncbi:MAG: hypothetical protein KAV87_03850, partial [Desulfobacteraceae bacterium]|nr:hypothetical protein [Desulfobacteraceae bacterium]
IDIKDDVLKRYRLEQLKRIIVATLGFVVLGAIVGASVSCLANVFLSSVRPSFDLFPVAVLSALALAVFFFLLDSKLCCVREADASDPKIWLGVILPSIPSKGELKMVQGSMNPVLFLHEWFVEALMWLKEEREVKVQIISGPPELEKMNEDQHERWSKYRDKVVELGLDVQITPERPKLQFTWTPRLLRIEKEHASWVDRELQEQMGYCEPPVLNRIHLFDLLLIWLYKAKFDRLWKRTIRPKNL